MLNINHYISLSLTCWILVCLFYHQLFKLDCQRFLHILLRFRTWDLENIDFVLNNWPKLCNIFHFVRSLPRLVFLCSHIFSDYLKNMLQRCRNVWHQIYAHDSAPNPHNSYVNNQSLQKTNQDQQGWANTASSQEYNHSEDIVKGRSLVPFLSHPLLPCPPTKLTQHLRDLFQQLFQICKEEESQKLKCSMGQPKTVKSKEESDIQ